MTQECFAMIAGIALFSLTSCHDAAAYGIATSTCNFSQLHERSITDVHNNIPVDVPTNSTAYLLGGTQRSLILKCRVAARLYRDKKVKRIIVASTSGMSQFDKQLSRNLSNDEWIFAQLVGLGVQAADISLIKLKPSLFGTLRESATLHDLCLLQGINFIVLICSEYHGSRVSYVFSEIFKGSGVSFSIVSADEQVGFVSLCKEKVKLFYYKYAVIPLGNWFRKHT